MKEGREEASRKDAKAQREEGANRGGAEDAEEDSLGRSAVSDQEYKQFR